AHDRPVEVVGAETAAWSSMAKALAGDGRAIGGPTMAEGIAVAVPGTITEPIVRALVADVLVVREDAIEAAVNLLLEIEKVVVEGAGATGVAAIAERRERFAGRRVGVVLTGGNIDPRLLASIIERGLVRDGRLARMRVQIDDHPGTLAGLLAVVGAAGANIVEVEHQRLFADVRLRAAEVDLTVECLDAAHRDVVLAAICSAGWPARLLALDLP
ncbi:MAG: pyridoxal-phosphate dependent enzyme, partial [Acidimicrobiia bacterium]|nr:pyridoxal-phosphate dependent enzyme [Acidimicrobiia bacterium]